MSFTFSLTCQFPEGSRKKATNLAQDDGESNSNVVHNRNGEFFDIQLLVFDPAEIFQRKGLFLRWNKLFCAGVYFASDYWCVKRSSCVICFNLWFVACSYSK